MDNDSQRTVVRIHINAATLAPIAHAPAIPPLAADSADFCNISRNDSCCSGLVGVLVLPAVTTSVLLLLLMMMMRYSWSLRLPVRERLHVVIMEDKYR
jgi:hypothetical protein